MWKYVWVKKCVEMREMLFKNWKWWFEITNQTPPKGYLTLENSGDTTLVHNFVHNSPTWRVVAGGGVTHHHPSTNHNSPCGQVVHIVVAPESLFDILSSKMYCIKIELHCSIILKKKKLIFYCLSLYLSL